MARLTSACNGCGYCRRRTKARCGRQLTHCPLADAYQRRDAARCGELAQSVRTYPTHTPNLLVMQRFRPQPMDRPRIPTPLTSIAVTQVLLGPVNSKHQAAYCTRG